MIWIQEHRGLFAGLTYLVGVNLLALAVYGRGKWLAKRGTRRVPEATLDGLALVGGSLGAFLGQRTFHHKTRKFKFQLTFWMTVLSQGAFVITYVFFEKVERANP